MRAKTVIQLIKKYGVKPRKELGQSFLMDHNLIDKIIDALELYPDEEILEIGPGLGIMTDKISRQAFHVYAIEKDRKMCNILKEEWKKANLQIINEDFLKTDLKSLLSQANIPIKVVGNIPYNISSQILFKLTENHKLFQSAVLTMQKEVAQRLSASVGTKDYGILTILMNVFCRCEPLFDIEGGAFYPAPDVTSRVVKITFFDQPPFDIRNPALFQKVVKMAFNQRRKTVRNALRRILGRKILPWETCKIDPESRPEQIGIVQYVKLANFLDPLL